MLLLFWNGSGSTAGSVKILPMVSAIRLTDGAVSIVPIEGTVRL
jgi:hypothetical protein